MVAIHVTLAQMQNRLPTLKDKSRRGERQTTFSESYNESDGRTDEEETEVVVETKPRSAAVTTVSILKPAEPRYRTELYSANATATVSFRGDGSVVNNIAAVAAVVDDFETEIDATAFNALAQYIFDWNIGILDETGAADRVRIPKDYEEAAIAKFVACFAQHGPSFLRDTKGFPIIYSFATTAGDGNAPAKGDAPHVFSLYAPGNEACTLDAYSTPKKSFSQWFDRLSGISLSPKIPVVKFWKSADDKILRCAVYMLVILDNTKKGIPAVMPGRKVKLAMLETIADDLTRNFPEVPVQMTIGTLIQVVALKGRKVWYDKKCVKYERTPNLDYYFDINVVSRTARSALRKLRLTDSNVLLSDEHVAELTRRFHVAAAIKHN
jgi:hypothetical protein